MKREEANASSQEEQRVQHLWLLVTPFLKQVNNDNNCNIQMTNYNPGGFLKIRSIGPTAFFLE